MSPDQALSPRFPFEGFAAACGAYLAVLMMVVCLLMYSRQRKIAYVYMACAFFFIMTYETLNIHQAFSGHSTLQVAGFQRAVQLYSFVLLNLSVLLLYKRARKPSIRLPLLSAVLLAVPLMFPSSEDRLWEHLYFDLFEGLALYISFAKMAPLVGQRFKVCLGLGMYALWAALRSMNYYIGYPAAGSFLTGFSSVLPLVFYSLVFFILFRRIIELMQSIYRSSITDGLTGLYNRRHFMKHLNQYVQRGAKVSAIFCDIDNFKRLNDSEGHARADDILKQVAVILEEELEDIGITGRYGGEELVALVVKKGSRVSQVAHRICTRVAEETMVTVSVGYSTLGKGISGDRLISQADEAMYYSKTHGKNRVTDYRHICGDADDDKEAVY